MNDKMLIILFITLATANTLVIILLVILPVGLEQWLTIPYFRFAEAVLLTTPIMVIVDTVILSWTYIE